MHNQGTHIISSCQWNTAFDSKQLAHQLQTDISAWSAYKMKRVINSVFDSICPKGQTLKIKKLALDLGAITYENMWSELPLRLEEALRNALYDLIMYPKNGDQTLEIIHEDIAQIKVLRDFLLQGILPWNYQETYGTSVEIMRSQLLNNRLDVIQMIQLVGVSLNVRKRIAWQFPDALIKKIIAGLEPNNHQQIINFSEKFVKVQEKETIVQTSTNDLKKNIWLWILNYLFTERGTIFNRIAFVRSTVSQMAAHFNISYDAMIELIEDAVDRTHEYSHIDKGFIAILKLLSEEVRNTTFSRSKTEKQQENFWAKVETYFYTASARSTNVQKHEFNELVINLSKLDASRFQKIMLNVEQKPTVWKAILQDLIPAAVENLFVALSPVQSKHILTQISFLSKLPATKPIKVTPLDLYTFGIEFCVTHQHTSVVKSAFLDFVIEKLAKKQQQRKLVLLDHFVAVNLTSTQKNTNFISLYTELNSLYQKEITNTKTYTSKAALQQILTRYATEIEASNSAQTLEKTVQKWISASPILFWNVIQEQVKTPKFTTHSIALISEYGTARFLKTVLPEKHSLLLKIQQLLATLISKTPKKATAIRAIKNALMSIGLEVVWKQAKGTAAEFFSQLLQTLEQKENRIRVSKKDIQEVMQLLFTTTKIRTLSWSAREFVSLQKQYKAHTTQTDLDVILAFTQTANQQAKVAEKLSELVRSKQLTSSTFKANEVSLISYFITNGEQLRTRLITKFLKRFETVKTNLNTTQIKSVLHELFWHVLVDYKTHRGNESRLISLFEKTVTQAFPALKTSTEKALKSAEKTPQIASELHTLQTPYQISIVELFEMLKKHLKTTSTTIEIHEKTVDFSALFAFGLETSPTKIRSMFREIPMSTTQLTFLKETLSFETFIAFHANDTSSAQSEAFQAIQTLFVLAKQLGNAQILSTLETVFWKQTIALIQQKKTANNSLKTLVKTTFDALSEIATLDQITMVKHLRNQNSRVPALLKKVLVERHQVFELIYEQQQVSLSETIQAYVETAQIDVLSEHLIKEFSLPSWFVHKEAYSYERVVNELIAQQPLAILKTIRSANISEVQLLQFVQTIHFEVFVATLLKVYTAQHRELSNIQKLYESIAFTNMRGISTKNIQEIILQKIVVAWRTSNWSLIASTHIWNELLWETCGKKAVQKQDFFAAINTIKMMLPTALLVTYKSLVSSEKSAKNKDAENTLKKIDTHTMNETFPEEGIAIPNAGLVLLNAYFLMLLARLEAVNNNAFISETAQLDAIHYLQYIVTGHTETEESLLTLNKVLVGISPFTPVKSSVDMTEAQKELINGMITASISHWTAIGNTSVEGFRGNWLVRDGILRETEERWELTVEKRAYDILMLKSPFSFSIIKLPWMEKPLHVTWPF